MKMVVYHDGQHGVLCGCTGGGKITVGRSSVLPGKRSFSTVLRFEFSE